MRTVEKELMSIKEGASSTSCTCTLPGTNVAHTSSVGTRNNEISDSAVPLTPQYPDYPTSPLLAALSPGSRQDHRNHVRPLTRITPATKPRFCGKRREARRGENREPDERRADSRKNCAYMHALSTFFSKSRASPPKQKFQHRKT